MYKCLKCKNNIEFREVNTVETILSFSEVDREVVSKKDKFRFMQSVTCNECGASTYTESIAFDNGDLVNV